MGKKRWNIRATQALLLLATLCPILRASAQSVSPVPPPKGKVSPVAQAHDTLPPKTVQSQPARQLTRTGRRKGPAMAKATHHSAAKTSPKKRNVKTKASAKLSPSAKSRTPAKSVARPARRYGQRKTVAAVSQKVRLDTYSEPGERPFPEDVQAAAPASAFFSAETAPFSVQLNDERLPYQINSVFVLPAERLTLAVGEAGGNEEYLLQAAAEVTQTGPNTWSWQVPRKTGLYPIKISHPTEGATLVLNVFVIVPFSQLGSGYVNGYRIGNYPRFLLKLLPTYHLPRGFIEVTPTNENVLVSPHFRLGQFLCKQEDEYPKYLVLDSRLLLVLESVLQKVNETGYHCPTFAVMSGYRTPYYNRAIGNSTTYSRHTLGDAADIFIDASPQDGEMDDLNRDGAVDFRDTKVLYNIVDKMYEPRARRVLTSSLMSESLVQQLLTGGFMNESPLQQLLTGGLARYRETSAHGPFVHVDVRGIYTRWGR